MASEYLTWKYRDVRPDAPKPLTPAERRRNWWHYHRWQLLAGAVVLLALLDLLRGSVGRVRPDFQAAYVGTYPLSEESARAVEAAMAAFCPDRNGDGAVVVRLNQYVSGGAESEPSYAAAAQVRLMADLEGGESGFFLLEDPETFQSNYEILLGLDGSQPEVGAAAALAWADCPALAGALSPEQALPEGLFLARRAYGEEEESAQVEVVWAALTEGVSR